MLPPCNALCNSTGRLKFWANTSLLKTWSWKGPLFWPLSFRQSKHVLLAILQVRLRPSPKLQDVRAAQELSSLCTAYLGNYGGTCIAALGSSSPSPKLQFQPFRTLAMSGRRRQCESFWPGACHHNSICAVWFCDYRQLRRFMRRISSSHGPAQVRIGVVGTRQVGTASWQSDMPQEWLCGTAQPIALEGCLQITTQLWEGHPTIFKLKDDNLSSKNFQGILVHTLCRTIPTWSL